MNLQTFRAPTMAECLSDVKRVMGVDAVILHTRTYVIRKWLKRREMVEITAGRGLNASRSRRGPITTKFVDTQPPPPKPLLPPAPNAPAANGKALLESPAGNSAIMVGLSNDMSRLTMMVNDLVARVEQQKVPQVPQELFGDYMLLVQNQVERDLAEEIIKNVHRNLRPDHLGQRQFVREKIAEQLEKLLPTSGPIVRSKSFGPHVVALIGPTGVGQNHHHRQARRQAEAR